MSYLKKNFYLVVRHHDEARLGVGVLHHDGVCLLLVLKDVVNPLNLKGLLLEVGQGHRLQ